MPLGRRTFERAAAAASWNIDRQARHHFHDNLIQSSLFGPLSPPNAIADQFLVNSGIISLSFS